MASFAPTPERTLLTVDEVAKQMGVARSFAWKLVSTNQIRSIRLGARARRVPATEFNAFIERKLAESYGDQPPAA